MRVLLLSAYDAPSHRYWRQGLERYFGDCRFTQLTLPPRYFSWRVRGNSLSWGWGARDVLTAEYDLLVATSLVDLSALRGFVPGLARLPTLLYFHENQFAYPVSAAQHASLEPQMVNLYSALCADRLLFNSDWNRRTFIAGVERLLRRLPDQVPPGLLALLAEKSAVLPVPVEGPAEVTERSSEVFDLVWNHRWEYDKGPATLLAAVTQCVQRSLPLRFHLIGQQFRRRPAEFPRIAKLLAARPELLGSWGFIEDVPSYRALLGRAHFVLSTALHEFQGLAVIEAVLHGCRPLVPDRLSYPEWLAARFRYPSSPSQPEREGERIGECLARAIGDWSPQSADDVRVQAQRFSWSVLGPCYRSEFERCRQQCLLRSSH